MNLSFIGINGYARSGKDTVAHTIKHYHPRHGRIIRLSTPIKRMLLPLMLDLGFHVDLDWSDEEVESFFEAVKDHLLNPDSREARTVRHALQTLGTEWGRMQMNEDFWLELAIGRSLQERTARLIIWPDIRFHNEAEFITSMGGTIVSVTRPGCEQAEHDSERFVDDIRQKYAKHVISNDGTKDDLNVKVLRLIKRGL